MQSILRRGPMFLDLSPGMYDRVCDAAESGSMWYAVTEGKGSPNTLAGGRLRSIHQPLSVVLGIRRELPIEEFHV